MFGEEDNITHDLVEADLDINDWTAITNLRDMFSDDYFFYGDWKEAGMLDMLIIETNARLLQYY